MSHGYVSTHAKERLKSRWGLDLSDEQWKQIGENAASGNYEHQPEWSGDILEPLLLVPIGPPDGVMHYIPMIVNLKSKRVVTVYPPQA